ncbi:WYL domain-containing protein [Undibacterium pigrum]|uniref:WYL domain-containing protein n=1 Tax=Undibacterium pigrum TaxID=401470 RepID=A0A318JFX5_9BURK|nr:WYL domain-containing protein [Undibacterium pigrum]PXX47466.1 WYL domain-containing protein [Undibacterium pigrum]
MHTNLLTELPAAQRERLAFIEFRLWFLGKVTRKDVMERFDIASAAGTRDLVLYRELAPGNTCYEGKMYHYRDSFQPLFQHKADRVLSALCAGFGDGERSMGEALLQHDIPARLNQPKLADLATITRAIQGQYPLTLTYHSMKTGPSQREIVPLALVDSGLRWHVRAYDRSKREFRDLVLTRVEHMIEIKSGSKNLLVQEYEQLAADEQWQNMIDIELHPHPSHPYPESIMRDYGMNKGKLEVRLRAAAVGYVLRQWQVDCSANGHLDGRNFRLKLANLSVLDKVKNAVLAPGYKKLAAN